MKLPEIERLRAVAALLVVCVHWWPLHDVLPRILSDPWSGVDLFFVISGYVVSLSLLRLLPAIDAQPSFLEALDAARPSIKTFYIRRFFRIMPPALAVALAVRVLAGVFPDEFGSTGDWFKEFLSFFGGIYNYAFVGTSHLNVYWSLAVEEHFYLLLPMLFLVFRSTPRRLVACLVVAAISIASRSLIHLEVKAGEEGIGPFFYSHNRFDSLMAGVVLALVFSSLKSAAAPKMPPWVMRWIILPTAIVLIACLPGAVAKSVMTSVGFIALWMLGGLLVGYAALDRGYVLEVPVLRRVLEYIGARSYALYLLHQQVFRLERAERWFWPQYTAFAPDTQSWLRVLVLCAVTWPAVELLYHGVERPMMRVGRRLLDAPAPPRMPPRWRVACAGAGVLFVMFYFRHAILLAVGQRDLARGTAVYQSSRMDNTPSPDALVNGRLEREAGPQTKKEKNPWQMIDLGKHTKIGALRIYNRDDGFFDENYPIVVEVSDDNHHWSVVARRDVMFTQDWPWRIRCYDTAGRYVRITAEKETPLCLSEVEVFASPVMASLP